ncbi:MAG: hypothetical protein H7Y59_05645 [Anaerolineales bacterium]|nr:hypothetical protein [Anaerolineales bacterium]
MFNFLKKEKPRQPIGIRDTLFGDLPISEWPKDESNNAEPWLSFITARKHLDKRDKSSAIKIFQTITEMPNLESRHYLQAWHFLRELKVNPPVDKAKTVYGVVVEVGMQKGADIVAAYLDHTARYLNYTGAGVIWERPDSSLDAQIEALINAGQAVANVIGPWDKERPAAPRADHVRLNMLTPSGLHFGYGGFETLAKEQMGKAIIDPATALMLRLTEIGKKK